jgi:pimeloyl-ACP methyl ester carboxylesterase
MNIKNILTSLILIIFISGCSSDHAVEIKKAKVNHVEIAYYTRGEGPPLLMIMGFRGTMSVWDPQLLEILEKHYKLILFDNRGIGLSTDTEGDNTTIPQMAEDALALIKSLGYDRTHVLGWSMGSLIAMHLAVHHPEAIETLILCSATPSTYNKPSTSGAYEKLTSIYTQRSKIIPLIFPTSLEGKEAANAFLKRVVTAILRKSIPEDLSLHLLALERQRNALKLWDNHERLEVFEALSKLKIPTLVAGGQDDILDHEGNVQILSQQIPFSWAASFPSAGHAFLFQDSKLFARLVITFIHATHTRSSP